MPQRLATYRITKRMRDAGAAALQLCRDEGGHTPQSVCDAVFAAMLNAADIHPGRDLRQSFRYSPHGDRRKPGKLTRADFDEHGVRRVVDKDGNVHTFLLRNFWYIK